MKKRKLHDYLSCLRFVLCLWSFQVFASDNAFNEFELEMDKIAKAYGAGDQSILQEKLMALTTRADFTHENKALYLLYRCVLVSKTEREKAVNMAEELKELARLTGVVDFQAAGLKCSTYASDLPIDDISNREMRYRAWEAVKKAKGATLRYWIGVDYAYEALRAGRNDEALEASKLAYNIARTINDPRRISSSIGVLALTQAALGLYDEALKSNEIALSFVSADSGKMNLLMNRGYIYMKKGAFTEALEVYREALKINEPQKNEANEVTIKFNMSEIYFRLNKTVESEKLLEHCIKLSQKNDFKEGLAYANMLSAVLQVRKRRLPEALALFSEAEQWFRSVGEDDALLEYAQDFSKELYAQGFYQQAYEHLVMSTDLSISIIERTRESNALFYNAIFESEKKNLEISLLNGEVERRDYAIQLQNLNKQRWLAFAIALVSVVFATVIAYLHLRRRHAKLELWSKELDYQSSHDALTSAYNRRYVERYLSAVRASDHDDVRGGNLLLVICDIDHFKKINDNYGHGMGDAVLVEVCARMKRHLRTNDVLARWGGEEFLLLVSYTEQSFAEMLIKRMLTIVADEPVVLNEVPISVSMSMGFCRYQHGMDAWEASLSMVDRYLYQAKEAGRKQAWGNISMPVADQMSLSSENLTRSAINIIYTPNSEHPRN